MAGRVKKLFNQQVLITIFAAKSGDLLTQQLENGHFTGSTVFNYT